MIYILFTWIYASDELYNLRENHNFCSDSGQWIMDSEKNSLHGSEKDIPIHEANKLK